MSEKQNLILVPGLGCDQIVWQHQQHHLADLANVIIVNVNGCETPEAIVKAIIEQAPYEFALAGHSLGGWMCLEVLKEYSHRVTKLCLLATGADKDDHISLERRQQRLAMAEAGEYEKVVDEIIHIFTQNEALKPIVRKMLLRNKNLFITQNHAALLRQSSRELLGTLTLPTMVMVGQDEKLFFESSEIIAHEIPGAKFEVIANCSHMLTIEKPEEVTSLMRQWLEH